ncbi:hypothetical protein HYQ60_0391 [Lactobacillus crispatus]|nr:hypothetical protein [Lactobacillus crispatus]
MLFKFVKKIVLTTLIGGGLVIPMHPFLMQFLNNLH